MNSHAKNFGTAMLLPCLVACLSLIGFFTGAFNFTAPSFYVSAAGLLAALLYFTGPRFGRLIIAFWCILQLVVITHSGPAGVRDIIDFTVGIKLPVYAHVNYQGEAYNTGLNLVAVFLLALLVFTRPKGLVGANLYFAPYRGQNRLGIAFPLKGRVQRQVNLSGEKDWLLVHLQKTLTYNGISTAYVLISRNDKLPIVKNMPNQLVFFVPVPDVNMLNDDVNDRRIFKDEVWALCK